MSIGRAPYTFLHESYTPASSAVGTLWLLLDLSEYQQSASADYHRQWAGCADLSPAFFHNSVAYSLEEKALYLSVDPSHEFEAMFDLYDLLDYPIPEEYDRELDVEKVARWRDDIHKI